jgi:hypothetical protein
LVGRDSDLAESSTGLVFRPGSGCFGPIGRHNILELPGRPPQREYTVQCSVPKGTLSDAKMTFDVQLPNDATVQEFVGTFGMDHTEVHVPPSVNVSWTVTADGRTLCTITVGANEVGSCAKTAVATDAGLTRVRVAASVQFAFPDMFIGILSPALRYRIPSRRWQALLLVVAVALVTSLAGLSLWRAGRNRKLNLDGR